VVILRIPKRLCTAGIYLILFYFPAQVPALKQKKLSSLGQSRRFRAELRPVVIHNQPVHLPADHEGKKRGIAHAETICA